MCGDGGDMFTECPVNRSARVNIFSFWGKSEKGNSLWHPAVCHMIDAGLITEALIENFTSSLQKYILKYFAGVANERECFRWVAFFAALHDLGKISPGFQFKRPDLVINLPKEDFPFSPDFDETDHGRVTFLSLREIIVEKTGCSKRVATGSCLCGCRSSWRILPDSVATTARLHRQETLGGRTFGGC